MGAGLILDGRLYHGTNDMAGEAGHIRLTQIGPVGYGKAGSFEGMCSGAGIAQIAKIKATELLQMGTPAKLCPDTESLETLTAKVIADAAKGRRSVCKRNFCDKWRIPWSGIGSSGRHPESRGHRLRKCFYEKLRTDLGFGNRV